MDTFRLRNADQVFSNRLALFDSLKQNTSVLRTVIQRVYPKTSITPSGPIYFNIDAQQQALIDTRNIQLTVKCQIVKADNSPIGLDDVITLTNLPLSSLFAQVTTTFNNIDINPDVGRLYSYAKYIEFMLYRSKTYKETAGSSAGYYHDTLGGMGTTEVAGTPINEGLDERYALTANNRCTS